MSEITTAARRIARDVNKYYGAFNAIFFSTEGRWVGSVVGPETFWPPDSDYTYVIKPTLLGMQPVHWTWRMVQDELDEQDKQRAW